VTNDARFDRAMNFMQGTLDLLVLSALAEGPLHGYDVVDWVRRVSRNAIQIEDGALYASLHRMEGRGWLDPEWRVSPKGRRAKYYGLTAEGRRQLRAGERNWARFADAVSTLLAARQGA
jgi:PadR family transcriptional regulator, regulatory protein PadR